MLSSRWYTFVDDWLGLSKMKDPSVSGLYTVTLPSLFCFVSSSIVGFLSEFQSDFQSDFVFYLYELIVLGVWCKFFCCVYV